MHPALTAVAVAALSMTAASAGAAGYANCFRMSDAHNHSVADDHTLYLAVGQKDVFRITTSAACLAGKSSSDPLITRVTAGSAFVCRPLDLDLKIGGTGGVSPCIVTGVARMTPEEVAAIPKKLRP